MSTARRIATAAAYGGGSIGLLGATLASVLAAEAKLARRTIGIPTEQAPVADGVYGGGLGPELSFVVLGDSSAAGLGVTAPEDTPGALLAAGLSELLDRPVRLTNVAVVGAQSADLRRQVDAALPAAPAAAVIMIGANDVTHRVAPATSVRHLGEAVARLREAGCEVVVGTCPDLGTIEPIAHPLRLIARHWSRRLAAAQTVGAVEAGARTVSLEFAARARVRRLPQGPVLGRPVPPVGVRLCPSGGDAAALLRQRPRRRACRAGRYGARARGGGPRRRGRGGGRRGRRHRGRRRRDRHRPDPEAAPGRCCATSAGSRCLDPYGVGTRAPTATSPPRSRAGRFELTTGR